MVTIDEKKELVNSIAEQMFTLDSIIRKLFPAVIVGGKKIRKSSGFYECEIEESLNGKRDRLYSLEIEAKCDMAFSPVINYFLNIYDGSELKYQSILGSYVKESVKDPFSFLINDERIISRAALIYHVLCLQDYKFFGSEQESAKIGLKINNQKHDLDENDEFFSTINLDMFYKILIDDHLSSLGETKTINLG